METLFVAALRPRAAVGWNCHAGLAPIKPTTTGLSDRGPNRLVALLFEHLFWFRPGAVLHVWLTPAKTTATNRESPQDNSTPQML